ncbi:PQQ enzyme repeat protein [Ancylostoma caninum]|uniref:PQQ enzyme repeat protein n=1 Tax=Ancylostoma caninum TaxID=29170 RepID=A0A368FP66_ANCCA|nr:PQQ enzyme repeat protein [Ancylostoma caninum]
MNGVRCNLSSLSELVYSIKEVFFAYFTVYKDKFLVLFVISETAIEDSLRNVIPSSFFPSKLIYLDQVPLTINGKVNRAHLLATLEEQCSMQIQSWTSILAFLGKFGVKSLSELKSHSFTDYAAEIALHLGNVEALHDILDPAITGFAALQKYTSHSLNVDRQVENVNLCNLVVDVPIIPISQPNVSWACDLEKCIDGDPILTTLSEEEVVVACSHSGLIVCVRVRDGYLLWKTMVNCRFEASPRICGEHIVVGAYDGGVYFLSASTGAVEWRFTCGDVIKAACAVDNNYYVYVPAYNRKLFKINSKSRECVWSSPIQSGSPASPVIVEKCVFQTTIKGSLEAIDAMTGMHLWIYQVQAPMFSSAAVFDGSGFIGSVDGRITKIYLKDGKKVGCSYKHSRTYLRQHFHIWQVSIYCHRTRVTFNRRCHVTYHSSLALPILLIRFACN